VLVRHLNKDSSLKAEYRGGGSIAFSAAARSVLIAERHPEAAFLDGEPGFDRARHLGHLPAR
jgi:hypothetical protein